MLCFSLGLFLQGGSRYILPQPPYSINSVPMDLRTRVGCASHWTLCHICLRLASAGCWMLIWFSLVGIRITPNVILFLSMLSPLILPFHVGKSHVAAKPAHVNHLCTFCAVPVGIFLLAAYRHYVVLFLTLLSQSSRPLCLLVSVTLLFWPLKDERTSSCAIACHPMSSW